MHAKRSEWMSRIRDLAVILGVLIALGTVGFVMPWNAASKGDLAALTDSQNRSKIERYRKEAEVDAAIGRIEGKLDVIIKMLERRSQ